MKAIELIMYGKEARPQFLRAARLGQPAAHGHSDWHCQFEILPDVAHVERQVHLAVRGFNGLTREPSVRILHQAFENVADPTEIALIQPDAGRPDDVVL